MGLTSLLGTERAADVGRDKTTSHSFSFLVLYDEGLYDDVGLKSYCSQTSG